MEKKATIEIKITGRHGKLELAPELYDIKDIRNLLDDVEKMLFPEGLNERPIISYKIEEGSVRHLFTTSRQTVVGFDAILYDIKKIQV